MLDEEELKDAALCVLANKQDLPGALTSAQVSGKHPQRQTDRQRERERDRQTDREKHTSKTSYTVFLCPQPVQMSTVCWTSALIPYASPILFFPPSFPSPPPPLLSLTLSLANGAEALGLAGIKNREWSIFQTSAIKGEVSCICVSNQGRGIVHLCHTHEYRGEVSCICVTHQGRGIMHLCLCVYAGVCLVCVCVCVCARARARPPTLRLNIRCKSQHFERLPERDPSPLPSPPLPSLLSLALSGHPVHVSRAGHH
jgi:hypothetical protein